MSNLIRILAIPLAVYFMPYGCGRKGDPVPHAMARPAACLVRWSSYRVLEIKLPTKDECGHSLVGIEKVRVYYLPLSYDRPTGSSVITRGKVVMEKNRQNVTNLSELVKLDLQKINYPPGWLAVVAMRVGDIIGVSSETLVWLDSSS
jgi:hypothetical protein